MLKLPQFRALSLAETPAFVKVTGSKFENDFKDFLYGLTSFCLFIAEYWLAQIIRYCIRLWIGLSGFVSRLNHHPGCLNLTKLKEKVLPLFCLCKWLERKVFYL